MQKVLDSRSSPLKTDFGTPAPSKKCKKLYFCGFSPIEKDAQQKITQNGASGASVALMATLFVAKIVLVI